MMRFFLIFSSLLCGPVALLAADKDPVNFTDHVLPIFRQHCLACHNANDAESGLAIDTYAGIMEGGGSGDAVVDGDPDGSRLYAVMTHAEEPVMPPDQDPVPKEQLDIIRKWIEGGLLENSGSKRKKRKGPSLSFSSTDSSGKPDQIVMPESVWRVPVVTTQRHAAASAIATSPWAPLVAVAGQRQVSLYHTETSDLLGVIPYPEGIPQSLKFSRDGAYLMVAGGTHASVGTASLYDIRTGDRLLSVGDELDVVFGADINDDLSKIAMGGPQRIVRIYDTSSGEKLHELKKHTDWVYSVAYSPDGVLVASGDRSGGLHVWEAETGRLYLDLIGHKAAVRGISWRADSNVLVSASEDGTVKLWEMNAGNQLKSFNAHGGGATGVMMARDGRMVTSGKDRTVKLWDASGKNLGTMPAFPEPALEAAITHDGLKVIGGDWSGQTIMWTIANPKEAVHLAADPPTLETQKTLLTQKVAELSKALTDASNKQQAAKGGLKAQQSMATELAGKLSTSKAARVKAEQDLAAAKGALAKFKTQREASAKEIAAIRQSNATITQQLNTEMQELNKQQQLQKASIAKRDELNGQLAKLSSEINASIEKQKQLKSSAIEAVASTAGQQLELAAKQRVAASEESDYEAKRLAAEQELASAEKQLNALDPADQSEAKSQLIVRRDTAKTQVAQWLNAKNGAGARRAELDKQLAQLAEKVASSEKQKADAIAAVAELLKQQATLQQSHDANAQEAAKHEGVRVATANKIETLNQSIASKNQGLAAAKENEKKATDALSKIDQQLKSQPSLISNLQKAMQTHTSSIANLEKQIESNKKQVQASTTALAEASKAAEAAQQAVGAAQAKVATLQSEIDAFSAFGAKLSSEASSAAKAAEETRAALEPEQKRAETLTATMSKREQELAEVAKTLKQLQSQLDALQKSQAADRQALGVAQAKMQDLQLAADKAESLADEKREKAEFFQSAYGD